MPPVVPQSLNQLRVLIVDDNPVAVEVMLGHLHPLPLRCATASDGEQALAMVKEAALTQDAFGLILLDWQLGSLPDGLEVAELLRADQGLPQPRIVMVTAYSSDEVLHRASPGLLDACLPKPVQPAELIETLVELFGGASQGSDLPAPRFDDAEPWALRGVQVLLVEDNPINQQIAQELLEIVGVKVTRVGNGLEALAWLQAHTPPAMASSEILPLPCDVVLLDLNMPEMDGWDCARHIRADDRWQQLPLIAMTAHAMQQEKDRCLALGMQDHISKPIDPDLLYGRLQHWCGRRRCGDSSPGGDRVPTGQEPSHDPAPHLLRLDGFDTAAALKRVAGNQRLYRRLLVSLVQTQGDAGERLEEYLVRRDLPAAESLVHTVKGVAANLGAVALADAASCLDAELKKGSCPPGLKQHFQDQLRLTLEQISTALALNAAEPHATSNEAVDDAPAPVSGCLTADQRRLLEHLDVLLHAADGEALDLMERERRELMAVLGQRGYGALTVALMRFDFVAARQALHQQMPAVSPSCLT